MNLKFEINGREVAVEAEQIEPGSWMIDGVRVEAARHLAFSNEIEFAIASTDLGSAKVLRIPFARTGAGIELSYGGRVFSVAKGGDAATPAGRRASRKLPGALTAPMQGIVADVFVVLNQKVAAHDPVMAIEAMKVIATIEAPVSGVVTAVNYSKGGLVSRDAIVAEIKPDIKG